MLHETVQTAALKYDIIEGSEYASEILACFDCRIDYCDSFGVFFSSTLEVFCCVQPSVFPLQCAEKAAPQPLTGSD